MRWKKHLVRQVMPDIKTFIKEYDRPGYTIEAGMGENPLPMTQFERIYHDNKGILVGGMMQLR